MTRTRNGMENGRLPKLLRSAASRAAGFFAFWIAIAGLAPADLAVGVLAVVVATVVSLKLLPAGQWRLRPVALMALVARFLRQSVLAGVDVAWRALHPRLPLRPGFIAYRLHLPSETAQSAFCAMASLLPGTLPCGVDEHGAVVVHCLDTSQPVAEQLRGDEDRFEGALGAGHRK